MFRIIKFSICLFFITFHVVGDLFAKEVSKHIEEGEKYFQDKSYRQALSQYQLAIAKNPGSLRAHLGFAKSSLRLGSKADALNSFKKVLELDPKNSEAIAGVAEILSLDGNFQDAIRLIKVGLNDNPYDPLLIKSEAAILLKKGDHELALRKLEDAKYKTTVDYDFNILLVQAYIESKRFKQAKKLIEEILQKYPENPQTFIEKAKLNFKLASSKEVKNLDVLMKKSLSLLQTAYSLDQNNDEGAKLLVKNLIWLGKLEDALVYNKQLLEKYPKNSSLWYINAYLYVRMGNTNEAAKSYQNLIQWNDFDEIGRYSAENFSLHNLNEHNQLRRNLGKYRYNRYKLDLSDFLYRDAEFNINRSLLLIPRSKKLNKLALDFYSRNKNLTGLVHVLEKMRDSNPDNLKIQNKIQNTMGRMKKSLAYREGFIKMDGLHEYEFRKPPEIFIFDPTPKKFLPDHPDSPVIIGESIKFALSHKPEVKVVKRKNEAKIRSMIGKISGNTAYTNGIYYSYDNLSVLDNYRKNTGSFIRFVGYGNFNEGKEKLDIDFHVYDRSIGKVICNIDMMLRGKNALVELSTRVSERVVKCLPKSGNVIKIKEDEIIVNLGLVDGIKKDQMLIVKRNGKDISKLKIKVVDELISSAVPLSRNWKRYIGLNDKVFILK
ncbi:MAG: tetratricopeptide repeat protein [Leptospiraceae bacterium]|nr:tetratricopeptide repeat protein [Leptospiraceae bacterium]